MGFSDRINPPTSLTLFEQPTYVRNCMREQLCAHVKNPRHRQPSDPLFGHMNILHTVVGTGGTALTAAV